MNHYTLAADGHRWWWCPTLAGAAATAAVATIIALPVAGQATPVPIDRYEAPVFYVPVATTTTRIDHPCFLYRARWNEPLDGPQPVCATYVRAATDDPEPFAGVIRAGLDVMP
jgi:hypothetical protein